MIERYFAPCPRGLEKLLAAELAALGAIDVAATDAGASFAGDFEVVYRVNLGSRIASRVLWRVHHGSYATEQDVYDAVRALPWHAWFSPERTIKVRVDAIRCPLRSLDFVTLRVKDAVCDTFRDATGLRPSVDTRLPDLRIHAFLDAQELSVYLDTSGEALFKRGLRPGSSEAPLKKNLAAGLLMLSGWKPGEEPLLDPMCGAGTILVEAAEMALGWSPGRGREFAFRHLSAYSEPAWLEVARRAREMERAAASCGVHGSDLYGRVLDLARANLEAAGLAGCVELLQANVLERSAPAESGVIVTNLPYGTRLGDPDDLAAFYPQLGDALKKRFAGWRAYLFTADVRLPKSIGLAASKRTPLFNGALECRLYEYRMVAGSMRRA
jgi:putative N6-adenine-specific DNA methylase